VPRPSSFVYQWYFSNACPFDLASDDYSVQGL
jgi:hypothetical protein